MRIPNFLLNDTASVSLYNGITPEGETYSDPVEVKCRFETTSIRYRSATGEEKVAKARMFFNVDSSSSLLSMQTKTLVEVNGSTYTVDQVSILKGFTLSHMELMLI